VNVAKGYKQNSITQHKIGCMKGSDVVVRALIEGHTNGEVKRMCDVESKRLII
jgi:hypothetical protein